MQHKFKYKEEYTSDTSYSYISEIYIGDEDDDLITKLNEGLDLAKKAVDNFNERIDLKNHKNIRITTEREYDYLRRISKKYRRITKNTIG